MASMMKPSRKTQTGKVHVKKNDNVIVISGKDKGKKGKVLSVFPKEGRVLVEGVNVVTKHQKPRGAQQPGGIIHQEAPIYASKVMLVDPKTGTPTRVGHKIMDDGSRVRISKKSGATID